jgi:CBS domain containing-hemolysin-like protein
MRPRKSIKLVSEDEVVGPMLMDELHKTGQTDFPVVKGSAKASSPVITGTLYLKDVVEIGQENKGKVKDLMKPGACFINEACDLSQALDAVLKKHQHQLIVVNNFEEVVGAITLKDLIGQLLGEPLAHEFEAYENLHAVAGISAESSKHHEQKEEAKATEAVESPSEEPIATQAQ